MQKVMLRQSAKLLIIMVIVVLDDAEVEVGRRETRACHKAVPDGSYYYLSIPVLTVLLMFHLVSCNDAQTW